jgi:hypothetical protein
MFIFACQCLSDTASGRSYRGFGVCVGGEAAHVHLKNSYSPAQWAIARGQALRGSLLLETLEYGLQGDHARVIF